MFQAKFLLLAVVVALAAAEYKIEPRIVQGKDATRGQFPFYVYLSIYVPQGIATCGGSLISDEWVVTAAHCLENAMMVSVHLGTLKAADWSENGRRMYQIEPEDTHIHPRYSLKFFAWNDIGLIKLPESVPFSNVIQPIPFACSSSSNSGTNVIAIGNGIKGDNDNGIPDILQYTELTTISKFSCLKSYPFLIFRQSVVCVKGEEKRSVCIGDSGGPLITSDNSLIGLTSFVSAKGCEVGAPQVFTRISKYASWIKEVSGVECKK